MPCTANTINVKTRSIKRTRPRNEIVMVKKEKTTNDANSVTEAKAKQEGKGRHGMEEKGREAKRKEMMWTNEWRSGKIKGPVRVRREGRVKERRRDERNGEEGRRSRGEGNSNDKEERSREKMSGA